MITILFGLRSLPNQTRQTDKDPLSLPPRMSRIDSYSLRWRNECQGGPRPSRVDVHGELSLGGFFLEGGSTVESAEARATMYKRSVLGDNGEKSSLGRDDVLFGIGYLIVERTIAQGERRGRITYRNKITNETKHETPRVCIYLLASRYDTGNNRLVRSVGVW